MILYYDILAPFESFGIGGKDKVETPNGIFYSHGVRDYAVDAIKLVRAMNKDSRRSFRHFKVAAFDSNGFNKWMEIDGNTNQFEITNGSRKVIVISQDGKVDARLYVGNGEIATTSAWSGKTEAGARKWAGKILARYGVAA